MKTLSPHPDRAANADPRTVTCVRDQDGNLAKVRRPTRAVRTPPPAAELPAGPPWKLPIPRVVHAVATSVAARYGVTVDAILSGERFPNTVRARHEWWRLVKDTWDLTRGASEAQVDSPIGSVAARVVRFSTSATGSSIVVTPSRVKIRPEAAPSTVTIR